MAPVLTWLCIMIAVFMRVANMIPINPSHLDSKRVILRLDSHELVRSHALSIFWYYTQQGLIPSSKV